MARRVVGFVALAAVVALGASPGGQTADRSGADYAAAIQAYVKGHDAAKAVAPLAGWTPRDVHSAVRRYLDEPRPRFTAAATLHLEIAVGVIMLSTELAENHLGLGNLLVGGLRPPSRGIPSLSSAETTAFAEKWYVAAASTFLMVNDSGRALPFINRGLQVAPASPELRLMTGIVDEMAALSTNPDTAVSSQHRGRILAVRTQSFMRRASIGRRLLLHRHRERPLELVELPIEVAPTPLLCRDLLRQQ